ncbi:MAG: hypothetical protein JNK30_14130 [Phenylobacterium sp.]|uniref:hypothetical protein n=1 Tax=Phenylobacterium sp. TaxID=1871053 RepID=UPI001A5612BA|nr:hypothetical protein [Phenylobacterium sp.]MBL8772517.1 hypothetical protein [Phenylobacterium sp.]
MTRDEDLAAAAEDELDRALTLGWRELVKVTPWGDTFEGFTPDGRDVCFERAYMWEGATGGDIRVEVTVYEPQAYEAGVRRMRTITRDGNTA